MVLSCEVGLLTYSILSERRVLQQRVAIRWRNGAIKMTVPICMDGNDTRQQSDFFLIFSDVY
jgi:hypothetical protein